MPQDSNGNETGWIGKYAHQTNGLAADPIGRQAMEDGYIQNAKIADATITAAKLATGVLGSGVYGVGLYGTALYG